MLCVEYRWCNFEGRFSPNPGSIVGETGLNTDAAKVLSFCVELIPVWGQRSNRLSAGTLKADSFLYCVHPGL